MANPNLMTATQLYGENGAGDMTTAGGTLITCGSGESRRLQSLRISAKTSTAFVVTVTYNKSAGSVSEPLGTSTPVALGESWEVLTAPINMMESDTISYTASAGTAGWVASWDRILP